MKKIEPFLRHMLDSISDILEYCEGMDRDAFMSDKKTQAAVIRNLEILGEAAKNVPEDFKKKNPQIEWYKIAGTRDKLIHHYFGVELDIVFDVVEDELPELKEQLLGILDSLSE
jgi:uncharacterized protein with HEPN domain